MVGQGRELWMQPDLSHWCLGQPQQQTGGGRGQAVINCTLRLWVNNLVTKGSQVQLSQSSVIKPAMENSFIRGS